MIGRIGLAQCGELVSILLPVKLSAINDDTTQRRTVTADKLGGRMHHDISSMFDRTNQVRCAKRIVDNQGDVMLMGYLSQCINIGHVTVRITEGLCIDRLGIGTNSSLDSSQIVYIDNGI